MKKSFLLRFIFFIILIFPQALLSSSTASMPYPYWMNSDRFQKASQEMASALNEFWNHKNDPEQLKKIMPHYSLNQENLNLFNEAYIDLIQQTPAEWFYFQQYILQKGLNLYLKTIINDDSKYNLQRTKIYSGQKSDFSEYIKTPTGVVYSLYSANNNTSYKSPLQLGGGFPFNQTQFTAFNYLISEIGTVDFYDALCTGKSVLWDTVNNNSERCTLKPYVRASDLIKEELAFNYALQLTQIFSSIMGLTLNEFENLIFRLTRLSFDGVTLTDQARAIVSLADQRGFKDGEPIFSGISYGGLIGAKIGALFPHRYKALVLFSPGVQNPAHSNTNKDLSAFFEGFYFHRRALYSMIKEVVYSPRYDAYRPDCLKDYDLQFRNSLQTKIMGELDMNLTSDLIQVKDPLYVVTGAKDKSVDPRTQIDSMKEFFKVQPNLGVQIIVPDGGHALWGNPTQSQEIAVKRVLEEVQKSEAGQLKLGGVYIWNKDTQNFILLGHGLRGLEKASDLIDQINSQEQQK